MLVGSQLASLLIKMPSPLPNIPLLEERSSAKRASVSTNTNTHDAKHRRQTCFYNCPRTFVNNCTTRNTFVCVQQQQQQQQQNPCTVIPRRALPPFSALLHFSLTLENQKCLNFHRSNHFSQNLLRNKAESSCSLQLRVTQTQIGFGAVLVKARTLYHQ